MNTQAPIRACSNNFEKETQKIQNITTHRRISFPILTYQVDIHKILLKKVDSETKTAKIYDISKSVTYRPFLWSNLDSGLHKSLALETKIQEIQNISKIGTYRRVSLLILTYQVDIHKILLKTVDSEEKKEQNPRYLEHCLFLTKFRSTRWKSLKYYSDLYKNYSE